MDMDGCAIVAEEGVEMVQVFVDVMSHGIHLELFSPLIEFMDMDGSAIVAEERSVQMAQVGGDDDKLSHGFDLELLPPAIQFMVVERMTSAELARLESANK